MRNLYALCSPRENACSSLIMSKKMCFGFETIFSFERSHEHHQYCHQLELDSNLPYFFILCACESYISYIGYSPINRAVRGTPFTARIDDLVNTNAREELRNCRERKMHKRFTQTGCAFALCGTVSAPNPISAH